MNKKLLALRLFAIFSTCVLLFPIVGNEHAEAFTNQVIQHGAVGDDVIELQARLQYLGFYNGKIDGVFGWGTYWALRNFQYEFGLPIDGLAGSATKRKLVKASKYNEKFVKEQINKGNKFSHYGGVSLEKQKKSSRVTQANRGGRGTAQTQRVTATNTPNGFSTNDIQLMANAVYGEARGEPYVGQVAVAAVILNRLESPSFPHTISGVIFEPGAFTAVADGQIWLTPNETARKAVLDAINGWDPTGNALYYFNPDTATSAWIWSRPQIKRIGKHIFCK
ncbi:spore cortex-lytic enzyme [Bacillus methanolicus]|uniref:Spore cortex-lytic enzyme n=1 Tax=Bacillus methanolicus (strain MGA3 / ATCC 53907) TaxID=796606 RepID=A0A068LS05_BACMM|nr:spore cortex-lytic enzyme [Bacillus methanolicus]AIE60571.1 Spore cortex-lytic enzyme [Bacillus methanolicus MGA3]UQD52580.1 spore cortex-lytic enzyme [Bacillus methanolicus]